MNCVADEPVSRMNCWVSSRYDGKTCKLRPRRLHNSLFLFNVLQNILHTLNKLSDCSGP